MDHVLARISGTRTRSALSSGRTSGLRNMSLRMEHRRLFGVRFEDGDETWFVSAKRQAASGSSLRHSGLCEALQSTFVI